jgi:predicted amidophosphoribosyltransferase
VTGHDRDVNAERNAHAGLPAAARRRHGVRTVLRDMVRDAAAVLAPTECAGCGAPDRGVCDACRQALHEPPGWVELPRADGRALRVFTAVPYEGVARRLIVAFKENGRTDVASALAPPLLAALRAALAAVPQAGAELVTIPSTRRALRERGFRPVELVLSHAGLRAARVLATTRQTTDQSSLGIAERRLNRTGSLAATRPLPGRTFIVVDDIVTTGATVLEVARAIERAGGSVLAAVAIAHTVRRRPQDPMNGSRSAQE